MKFCAVIGKIKLFHVCTSRGWESGIKTLYLNIYMCKYVCICIDLPEKMYNTFLYGEGLGQGQEGAREGGGSTFHLFFCIF